MVRGDGKATIRSTDKLPIIFAGYLRGAAAALEDLKIERSTSARGHHRKPKHPRPQGPCDKHALGRGSQDGLSALDPDGLILNDAVYDDDPAARWCHEQPVQ